MDGTRLMGILATDEHAASRGDARFTLVTYAAPSSHLNAT
jgi:hypothetical protein